MAEKPPAYQWYPKDFMSSSRVALMDLAEQGAYRRLLDHQWLSGSIPDDVEDLARLCGTTAREMSRIWRRVAPCFEPHPGQPGQLINPRLERQRMSLHEYAEAQAQRGAAGGRSKWGSGDARLHKATRAERLALARTLGKHAPAEWHAMLAFFRETCLRCGRRAPEVRIVKDHIVPIYAGGDDSIRNLQPLCVSCNGAKGADRTDHRRAHSNVPAEWLADASPPPDRMPGGMPGERQADALPTPGSADCSLRSADRTPLTPLRGRGERRRRRDAAPRRVVAAVESERFSRLWSAVRRGMGAKSWEDWFACCAPLDERDGVLVVGAPNVLVCEWLERTFRGVLDELAAEHAPGVRVELRVAPPGQVAP